MASNIRSIFELLMAGIVSKSLGSYLINRLLNVAEK